MKFTAKTLGAAALAFGLVLGGSISGEAAQGDNQAPRYQMRPYGYQLTPEQQAQAQKIYNDTIGAQGPALQAYNSKRNELDQEMTLANPDTAKIERLSREIGELRGKLLAARAEARSRLAQQGLPPDCMGPCNGWADSQTRGWGDYGAYHHGRKHGGRRGHNSWDSWRGMGMMGGWY